MDPRAEIRTRINLLPMQAKIAEVEARTASCKARKELTEAQTKATELKAEKIALENEEKRAMIQLYAAAVDAVERLGARQAVEADFEVIDNLKQIGVKIPPKIKSAALLKQTVRGGKCGMKKAKGHGAPLGNQNAKGHGVPMRNTNAVKHGIYLRWESGEGPKDRLPPGAGAEVLKVLTGEKELQEFCARASLLVAQVGVRMAQRPYWK